MFTDTRSAEPCGCDPGAKHLCEWHTREARGMMGQVKADVAERIVGAVKPGMYFPGDGSVVPGVAKVVALGSRTFGTDAATRKGYPIFTGVSMYFPDALAAVAFVSKLGNDQHNPGQPLHWAREKSTDQMDTAARHMMDHGVGDTKDSDGAYHLAKAAWRILAELQLTIEREREGK